jgi:hypothetical protein
MANSIKGTDHSRRANEHILATRLEQSLFGPCRCLGGLPVIDPALNSGTENDRRIGKHIARGSISCWTALWFVLMASQSWRWKEILTSLVGSQRIEFGDACHGNSPIVRRKEWFRAELNRRPCSYKAHARTTLRRRLRNFLGFTAYEMNAAINWNYAHIFPILFSYVDHALSPFRLNND